MGPCKLGYGRDPTKRLRNMQVGNHLELKIYSSWISYRLTARQLESAVHSRLANRHLRGEWFKIAPAEVACVIAELPDVKPFDKSAYFMEELTRAAACHPRHRRAD